MSLVHLEPTLSRREATLERAERDDFRRDRTRVERTARRNTLRRRIKILCFIMLLTYCARFVLTVTVWDVSDSSFTIPFSLGVAYCGLVGASRENRDTLSCFYVCCVASICLYAANVMVQTKMILDVRNGEEIQGQTYTSKQVFPVMITAIGLETFLAIIQVIGAMSGRELVRKHLVVNFNGSRPHLYTGNSYSIEFIQQNAASRSASEYAASLTDGLNTKMTIASIPHRRYVKGSRPESFPIAETSPVAPFGMAPADICVEPSPDGPAPATCGPLHAAPRQNNDDDDLCVICQDELVDGVTVKVLPCRHYFHVNCIDAWLERSLHCPMCMQEIPVIRFYEDTSSNSTSSANSNSGAAAARPATADDAESAAAGEETHNAARAVADEAATDRPQLNTEAQPVSVILAEDDLEAAMPGEAAANQTSFRASEPMSSASSQTPAPAPVPPPTQTQEASTTADVEDAAPRSRSSSPSNTHDLAQT